MPSHPAPGDTIVAISTPPGRGGIGIIRLSGPEARQIATPMLRLRQPLAHAIARFGEIVLPGDPGHTLDEAIVTAFTAPHSYTAEDVVEIAAHGSPIVLHTILRYALAHGARLARPGEFTERAFLAGRIDLTQAEAVRDLIEAQTIVQARLAAEQLGGALSLRIAPIKEQLVALIATLEAGIDFAEDDIDVMPAAEISARIAAIDQTLQPIAASYAQGRLVHDGLTLAIIGRPNAGKSSLFNRLVERDRAIVTPVPGTTRDLVTETVAINGIPVQLIDTAGLRDTEDPAESIGIAKTRQTIAEADIILLLLDASHAITPAGKLALTDQEQSLIASLKARETILVLNKIDLLAPAIFPPVTPSHPSPGLPPDSGLDSPPPITPDPAPGFPPVISSDSAPVPHSDLAPGIPPGPAPNPPPAQVSALTGEGIPQLREAILHRLQTGNPEQQTGLLTNLRHQQAVTTALTHLATASTAVQQSIPHEMVLLDLYAALSSLDSLTGTTTPDDILNRIFSTFCIGK